MIILSTVKVLQGCRQETVQIDRKVSAETLSIQPALQGIALRP